MNREKGQKKSFIRSLYRVFRSLILSVAFFVAGLYIILFVLLSFPVIQNIIRDKVETELGALMGSRVEIGHFDFKPFNELVFDDITIYDTSGRRCLAVNKIGAGISIRRLILDREIVISYAEVLGLSAHIYQEEKESPYNIQFLIDAFSPRNQNKNKTHFKLNLKNVVLRNSNLSFDRFWASDVVPEGKIDFNHLKVEDLRGDLTFPLLSDSGVEIDMRRLAFNINGGLQVTKIAFNFKVSPESMDLRNFVFQMPETIISLSDLHLAYDGYSSIKEALSSGLHMVEITGEKVSPQDLAAFVPIFEYLPGPFALHSKIAGNTREVEISDFSLIGERGWNVMISGAVNNIGTNSYPGLDIKNLHLSFQNDFLISVSHMENMGIPARLCRILGEIGNINIDSNKINFNDNGNLSTTLKVATDIGLVNFELEAQLSDKDIRNIHLSANFDDVNPSAFFKNIPISDVNASVIFDGNITNQDITGEFALNVDDFAYNGSKYDGLDLDISKDNNTLQLNLSADNSFMQGNIDLLVTAENLNLKNIGKEELESYFTVNLRHLSLDRFKDKNNDEEYFSGTITGNLAGSEIDNIRGVVSASDLKYEKGEKFLSLEQIKIESNPEDGYKNINLESDWIDGEITGDLSYLHIRDLLMSIAHAFVPDYVAYNEKYFDFVGDLHFSFLIKEGGSLTKFLNIPYELLVDIPFEGSIDAEKRSVALSADIPYLLKGRDKLIHDTRLNLRVDGVATELSFYFTSVMPVKNGEMQLDVSCEGWHNELQMSLDWRNLTNPDFKGVVKMMALAIKNEFTGHPQINLSILPSTLQMGAEKWLLNNSILTYTDKFLTVDHLRVWHDDQKIEINGVASPNPDDIVKVELKDIDVDYIFDTLNINYVDFGGVATGIVEGSGLLGSRREAATRQLFIKDLSYNNTLLGDGDVSGIWHEKEKMIGINADIVRDSLSRVICDGGIWLGRDSLSFDISARKVDVKFIQPFMQAFSSDIKGIASGDIKLFGTFKDIDLIGSAEAENVEMKLDYTNTYYNASDSIFFNPGEILIPGLHVYDKFGRSAIFSGQLSHRYFHEPKFNFKVSDMDNFLSYETNVYINPDWYGTFFCTGGASISGADDIVNISIDVAVDPNSNFTFVLNETQAAEDYHFLTFTDKRKAAMLLEVSEIDEIRNAIKKKQHTSGVNAGTDILLDIRATVTPGLLVTLVMDPQAGDKITARGRGALQVEYQSKNDEMLMYGKYEIEEGNYNFSLQDLILRDFKINSGSSISFNGNPLHADLDISASYRVNTNLSDLDKSFSTDRDLNRTNVPVDAILMVRGETTHPTITFDIALPTLTQDVERKVRSIISTDDMMSRQIIYLLALNKFYTPEYMGNGSNSGDLTAVASTTISSQISNMISQLTDKFTLSPSFRSDKGDFSDLEVDVALSSSLLNNRLLVNGNFGYRDKNNSNTTFIGDFDIEYLLNKNGNLRLKAYNHFNDQNYYLRQALTTQGLGIVFKKDFDNPFYFLKKKRKEEDQEDKNSNKSDNNLSE